MKNSEAIHDLSHGEAVSKIRELVKHNNICLFTSNLTTLPLQTRPMAVQEVDDDGNIWFLSSKSSHKNFQVEDDPRVQLMFANRGDNEFLSIYGEATIYTDRNKIEDIWSPIAKAWFKEGKNDPDLSVIKVSPEDAYYWDTKHNKAVSLIKIMASVVSGASMDDGVEGRLRV